MTPTADDLLPCPFCGGEATVTGGSPFQPITTVWCDVCHSRGNPDTNPALAIAAWNTRAVPRWIPMTERKPKDGQIVAIFKPDALENDDEYETVEWNVRYNDLDISRHLWYPLPEPPKEVEG